SNRESFMTEIAVLYPGAVGTAIAEALAACDQSCVSYLAGRSARTHENAGRAHIRALSSMDDVVLRADLVISVVPPGAAIEVASRFAAKLLRTSRSAGRDRPPVFLDANSISPATAVAIDATIAGAGGRFVDGVFLGPAAPINRLTTLMLSGAEAPEVARMLSPPIPVKIAGTEIGQASAVKMAMALLTKAQIALFAELVSAAAKAACLDATLDVIKQIYPGTMEFLERSLPTYPTHIHRRIEEMREAESWLDGLGETGAMTRAATLVLERLSATGLDRVAPQFRGVIGLIAECRPLAAADQPGRTSQRHVGKRAARPAA
ncbi:MAG: DUF1932 domain-containing protein, partial [Stellaceae bacterium]